MLFGGPGVKEIDDFGETSRINAKFLGDSVEFDAKKHKVRCRRNCLLVANPRSAEVRSITLRLEEQAALRAGGPHPQNMGVVPKGFHGTPSCIANGY